MENILRSYLHRHSAFSRATRFPRRLGCGEKYLMGNTTNSSSRFPCHARASKRGQVTSGSWNWSTAGRDSPQSPESVGDAYRVANATPFAAFAMIAATAFGCDT